MIVVIGFMGAGKTTVGRMLAERLGLPFVDSDLVIEHQQHREIRAVFAEEGQARFRDIEQETIQQLLAGPPCVLALGGGACGREATRENLRGHTVVYLHVEYDEAMERVDQDECRPLLHAPDLPPLYAARLSVYEQTATVLVRTTGRRAEDIAFDIIDRITGTPRLDGTAGATSASASPWRSPDRPDVERISVGSEYDVVIGRGLHGQLVPLLGDQVASVMAVTSASVRPLAERLADEIRASGRAAHLHQVPDAEAAKTVEVAAALWKALGQTAVTRSDAVVAVGGGAVTDLAGFVAATWLRGIPIVHVPTTLLAMVDAAVGGKTGINTDEGKNLVGAFHPPAGVLCDLDRLATLPRADYVAGLAEVVKCGFIADPAILELVEADPHGVTDPMSPHVAELVARSVAVKADVVAADLRESGPREALNYGHTFAHAVEQVEGYSWRHGEAVSVGLVYAACLGRLAGRTDPALAARHSRVLHALGLPVSYRGDRWKALAAVIRRDKKARGSLLRFVVLDGLGRTGRLEGPSDELLEAAYRAVAR